MARAGNGSPRPVETQDPRQHGSRHDFVSPANQRSILQARGGVPSRPGASELFSPTLTLATKPRLS